MLTTAPSSHLSVSDLDKEEKEDKSSITNICCALIPIFLQPSQILRLYSSLIVLFCVQFVEKKKNLRKVYRLENLSKKDEGASGKLVKTGVLAVFNKN